MSDIVLFLSFLTRFISNFLGVSPRLIFLPVDGAAAIISSFNLPMNDRFVAVFSNWIIGSAFVPKYPRYFIGYGSLDTPTYYNAHDCLATSL